MPPSVSADKSRRACEMLIALPEFRQARTVMGYLPIPHEVDLAPVALAAWQDQKTFLAPKVNWEQRHMIAVECRSLDDEFTIEHRGIREPADGDPWPEGQIDLIIVPALAYDRRGHRLGRGGGFYDRFLARPGLNAVACGLGFDEQLVDRVPVRRHDHPLDMLVTDREVLTFVQRPRRYAPRRAPEHPRKRQP